LPNAAAEWTVGASLGGPPAIQDLMKDEQIFITWSFMVCTVHAERLVDLELRIPNISPAAPCVAQRHNLSSSP